MSRQAGLAERVLDFPQIPQTNSQSRSSALKTPLTPPFREVGQRFHETIASMSGRSPEESKEHSAIIRALHESTTNNKNYPQASCDLGEMLKEHREIANAIKAGDGNLASRTMHNHLKKHHDRVKASAFGPSQKQEMQG